MYRLVGQEYIDMMNSNRGVLAARIVIGEIVVESEQIYSVTCEAAACQEKLSVGNFILPKLNVSISSEVVLPLVTSGLKVTFYVGMSTDGIDFEYAPVCSADLVSVTRKGQLYEITTKSGISNKINQLYSSELTFPQTSHSVLQELGNYTGVEIDCEGVSDFTIDTQPSGYSCREIIASIAEKSGVNAFVSRDDSTIIFKWFEDTNTAINSDCINEPSLAVEPMRYRGVTCTSGSELLVHGEEPFLPLCNTAKLIVQSGDLVPILNSVSNVTFHPGSISMLLGNILYDPWDIVTVVIDDDTVMLPVCNLSHKYDGGLTTEIRIPEQEKVSSDGSSSSKTTAERAVDRLTAELFSAKQIMADKASVNELSANLADFENATAESFQAQQAKISNLEAEKLNADELSAKVANLGYATVDSLKAESARIDELDATKLEASSAEIKNLEAGVADINTLMFGAASGDVIQTEFANAVVAQLGDAQVKSAMIESVSAGKLTAGDIVTNNVRVVSEDGSLLIEDETMQISDGNALRVQIGKDALGDYSLYVWDKDGKLMFDALGVHEAGIKSGIIRDDMVSDTANISAGKLNIDSLFTAINEDGSNTLKASKVLLDENNQTLEVAFKSMDDEVSSMGTQIQAVQGQISSKVWQQDITKAVEGVREDFEGEVETLSTSYSELSQTVGNINATVAKHTDDINSASSRVAELELSVDSFKSEVSSTYTTKEEYEDTFDIHGTASGSSISVSDSAESLLEGLSIYGKTTQDGTPTPDAPIELVSVGDEGTVEISITDGNEQSQSIVVATPNSLRGIPVTSGGNYTDDSGQQWICDEVDFERGVYVKRINSIIVSKLNYLGSHSSTGTLYAVIVVSDALHSHRVFSNRYAKGRYDTSDGCCYITSTSLVINDNRFTDVATANAILKNEKPEFLYVLASPIETPLTDEQLEVAKTLTSYYPVTNVVNDENADMTLGYRRYTKTVDFVTPTEMNSAIEQSADELKLSVEETTGALDERLTSAEASIQVNADNITQKVSAKDYNGEKIASLINQSAEEVSIDAQHIKLEGIVTANEGFKIDTDGSMEATAGTIGGWKIGESELRGDSAPEPDYNRYYSITLSRAPTYDPRYSVFDIDHQQYSGDISADDGLISSASIEKLASITAGGNAFFQKLNVNHNADIYGYLQAKNFKRGTLKVVVSNNTTLVTTNIPTNFTPSETTQCVATLRTVGSPSPRYINCWVNYFKPSETAAPLLQACMTGGGSTQTAVPAGTYYIDYIIADV